MKKTIRDFDITNKTVIIRCDLNVPMKNNQIMDDNRIINSVPTIKYALESKAKVVILSHLGRIKNESDKINNSLEVVSKYLSKILSINVEFVDETRGSVLENKIKALKPGEIILVQNTRYEDYPDKLESGNDENLGKYWASLGDIFINDAFGTCHRAHASNVGIASNLPSGIGFLVEKELSMLNDILSTPKHPYVVIMGGAKINDKVKVIDKLISQADYLLVGGGIANTFLVAKGYDLKKSIYDKESVTYCKRLLEKYSNKIILPADGYFNTDYIDGPIVEYALVSEAPDGMMMLDIGPKTIELFETYISKSKTCFWNGPVGVSEFHNFEYGTKKLCEILYKSCAEVIIGGGDSAAAAIKFGYKNKFKHISTGGGAALELIEGKQLPGINVVDDK